MPRQRHWLYGSGTFSWSSASGSERSTTEIGDIEPGETVGHVILRSYFVSRLSSNTIPATLETLHVGVRLAPLGFDTDPRFPNSDAGSWMLWNQQVAGSAIRVGPISEQFTSVSQGIDRWDAETQGQRRNNTGSTTTLGITGVLAAIPPAGGHNPMWIWALRALVFSGPASSGAL